MTITLLPLSPALHVGALQHLYRATPGYWQLYQHATVPPGQAARDMRNATETPGRYMMGVVQPTATSTAVALQTNGTEDAREPDKSGELIGLVDFRLDWPEPSVAYLGMVMVAERHQRRGIGTAAWTLLQPWLAGDAGMQKVRLGVEQFNTGALQFFEQLGFTLTGEAERIKVEDRLVRLLYMDYTL